MVGRPYLLKATRPFRYFAQAKNLGYDGNVRFCLSAAKGTYVMMLGNDDALATPTTLSEIDARLRALSCPEVAFTNYEDWKSGAPTRRAVRTGIVGAGPSAAIRFFRTFSFVSGLIFRQEAAVLHETDRWDTSVYYQIYLACRVLAAGGRLGAIDLGAVRKDVRIADQTVLNHASKWGNSPWSFQPRHAGLDSVMRVAADGVLPLVPEGERSAALRKMMVQMLTVTYPFWLFEYRRVANWSFSVGVARGLSPTALLAEYPLDTFDRGLLWAAYLTATAAGLGIPVRLFDAVGPRVAQSIRRFQQRR